MSLKSVAQMVKKKMVDTHKNITSQRSYKVSHHYYPNFSES